MLITWRRYPRLTASAIRIAEHCIPGFAAPTPPPPATLVSRMYSRLVPPLLCALAVALACRPGARPTVATAAPKHHRAARGTDSATVALRLAVDTAHGIRFALQVVNEGDKRVEMRFRSGLVHDFVVLDEHAREVWRWSEGRMFTQAVQNRVLAAGDSLAFAESWKPDRPGHYTVVARLYSPNYPAEQRAEFDVPAAPTGQLAVH